MNHLRTLVSRDPVFWMTSAFVLGASFGRGGWLVMVVVMIGVSFMWWLSTPDDDRHS